ncbi:hypothetical protein ACFLYA_01180 [Candidatus Dependentiae bacterium]
MKKQIMLLSLLLAIPSQIYAKEITVKNQTGQDVSVDVIANFEKIAGREMKKPLFYALKNNTELTIPNIKSQKKGEGLIKWRRISPTKLPYYQILPHGKITSVTLKPYGKYDVTVKKLFGTKTLENQAADISKGIGKQGIHIYNATNKKIKVSVQGSKWENMKPEEESFMRTVKRKRRSPLASVSEDEEEIPILRWMPPGLEQTGKNYIVDPDEKIEEIKSIVLKPNGQYDLTVKLKKDVTETSEEKSDPVLLKDMEEFGLIGAW